MGGKWLSVLKEIAPGMKRAGALFSSDAAPHASFLRAAQAAASRLGVSVTVVDIKDRGNIERAISLAARSKLPAIYPY